MEDPTLYSSRPLSEQMKIRRADAPDEWAMDEFARKATDLQAKLAKAEKDIAELEAGNSCDDCVLLRDSGVRQSR